MTPDRISAALFAAAILSSRRELDAHVRVRIISRVPAFDLNSTKEARDALAGAFQSAGVPTPRGFRESRIHMAAATAKEWLKEKIFVMSRQDLATPQRCARDIPEMVFARGDPSILSSGAAAILNSRKPRRTTPGDSWITATRSLVRYAEQAKLTVVSSYGTIPYCMVSRLALSMPLIVVCDDALPFLFPSRAAEFFSEYGDLFRCDSTLFISPFPPSAIVPRDVRSAERDLLVAALASVLLVADIRPGGNTGKIVDSAAGRNVEIVRFADQSPAARCTQPRVEMESPSHATVVLTFKEAACKMPYLIHYTRSCPRPWPGQTVADYCMSLANGCERSAHTGFDTLFRILEENLVRGSSRLTRRALRVVSLTECPPEEILTLTEWRKSLIRWSFEPYGIAFPKEDLFELGALPVIYAVEEAFQDLSTDLQHLFQIQGRNSTDWTAEKEWRVRGDLILTDSLREKMVVIVPTREEAAVIEREFGCTVALAAPHADSSSCEPD